MYVNGYVCEYTRCVRSFVFYGNKCENNDTIILSRWSVFVLPSCHQVMSYPAPYRWRHWFLQTKAREKTSYIKIKTQKDITSQQKGNHKRKTVTTVNMSTFSSSHCFQYQNTHSITKQRIILPYQEEADQCRGTHPDCQLSHQARTGCVLGPSKNLLQLQSYRFAERSKNKNNTRLYSRC